MDLCFLWQAVAELPKASNWICEAVFSYPEKKKQGGLSAKEYKKKMEKEKEELNKKLEDMVKEYNELADRYNKLIDDKAELERKNKEKAYEVMCQQERGR